LSLLESGEWESDDTAAREGSKIKIRYGLQVSLKQIQLKNFCYNNLNIEFGLTAITFSSGPLQFHRYPLTGYQAFCMCLTSMDAKLCCTV